MDDYKTETSLYSAAVTDYLPEFGRALLVAAVEFSQSGLWIAEHYVVPPEDGPIKSSCIKTHFNARSIPEEILPKPPDELRHAMSVAEAALELILFERDRELFRFLHPISQHIKTEITPSELAILYLRGEFSKGLAAIRDSTKCDALTKFLADVLKLPKFKSDATD